MKIRIGLITHANKLALLLLIGGIVGFAASSVLTIDKLKLMQDPSFVPACNVNPIISCGSVMTTPQASVFGFANSAIGVVGFAVLIAIGVALLAGVRFKKWFWLLMQVVATLGLLFVHWLIYESLYRLGTLCPYCVVVWIVTIPVFWYITLYNFKAGYLPKLMSDNRVMNFLYKYRHDVLIVWYLVLIGLILHRFWYYWQTLI